MSKHIGTEAMPLEELAGRKKLVPPDHPWVVSARRVGTNLAEWLPGAVR